MAAKTFGLRLRARAFQEVAGFERLARSLMCMFFFLASAQ